MTTTTWWDHAIEIALTICRYDHIKCRVHWSVDDGLWCVTPAVGK